MNPYDPQEWDSVPYALNLFCEECGADSLIEGEITLPPGERIYETITCPECGAITRELVP